MNSNRALTLGSMSECARTKELRKKAAARRSSTARSLELIMIGRDYFARQAATLLRLAHLTRDAGQAARLAAKAVELKERCDATPPPADVSPFPPDIEARDRRQGDRR